MKTQLAGLRAATQTCGGCQGTRGPAVPNVNTRSKGHGRKEPRGGNDPKKKKPARMEAIEKEPES